MLLNLDSINYNIPEDQQSWTKPVKKIYRHVQFWFYKNEVMPFIHYNLPSPWTFNVGFSSHVM